MKLSQSKIVRAGIALAAIKAWGTASLAYADSSGSGGSGGGNVGLNLIFKNLIDNTEGILDVISFSAYVLCIAMTAFALFALKKYMENPAQNPFMKALATGLTAASLGLLPVVINALKETVGGEGADTSTNMTIASPTISAFD